VAKLKEIAKNQEFCYFHTPKK